MFYIKYYWILYIYCTSAGIFSLFLFIHKQCEKSKEWTIHDLEDITYKEYDYIVVGGGSAGSIVASRLAEDKNSEVLLIEAGGNSSILHDIPVVAPMLQRKDCDWLYQTVPQQNACLALTDRVSNWPMGKILGGTSRLNYMVYLRGHPTDFDSWLEWSWPEALYYFKKNENHIGRFSTDSKNHGSTGPIYVSDIPFPTELSNLLLEAASRLGFLNDVDLNSFFSNKGRFMRTQVTGKDGSRWSADQVLRTVGDNLQILTYTVVDKVLLRKGFEAYGVLFRRRGVQGKAFARKAVILSAGVIGTPKILMLSGIGPKEDLLKIGIKPKVSLPVGSNLQDHLTTGLDLIYLNISLPLSWKSMINSFQNTYQYLAHGTGILTHPGAEVIGLLHTNGEPSPDLQLMALPAGLSTDAGVVLAPAMGISKHIWDNYFSHFTGEQVITILPVLLHPRSRGTVKLRSKDPDDRPIIDPQYLSHPSDIKTLVRGIKIIEKIASVMPGASLNRKMIPGCERTPFGTDRYWECYVRHLTLTAYHPCGTAAIGLVVSPKLRVYNTSRLYVMDASVMPSLTSGNINAAVMMIAEKGVDLIKESAATSRATCHPLNVFIPPKVTYIS
nr:glucose dehydrogenase 3 [Geocoris pallidipennis]